MNPKRSPHPSFSRTGILAVTGFIIGLLQAADAVSFSSGDLEGSIDTTVSAGMQYRLDSPSPDLIGIANGGTALSTNYDDGNLNYGEGISSMVGQFTTDIELNYLNFGAFVRLNGFYDRENENDDRERTRLSDIALKRVGSRVEFLDYYGFASFDSGDIYVDLRLGSQVLNWGESSFVQGGINVINPIDVAKLRLPGSELREALLPVQMVSVNIGLTENVSLEAFYQLDWEEIVIDPDGTFFSTNDFVSEGGERLFLGFGAAPEYDTALPPVPVSPYRVPRGRTVLPGDSGQYGLALRWIVPQLNETEFGFYYINYHSRLPYISGRSGTLAGLATGDFPGSAEYFVVYPEDIKVYGVSFNSEILTTGIAVQGELSYRPDMPLQVDDVELLYSALSAPGSLLATTPPTNPAFGSILGAWFLGQHSQLGATTFGQEIQGYRETDYWQGQVTFTKLFGPTWGADQWVLVGEVAFSYADLPDRSELRFDAPATYTSGNAVFTTPPPVNLGIPGVPPIPLPPIQPATADYNDFATDISWGYRIVTRWDFNNVFMGVNMSPLVAFNHDVDGVTPLPVGNFLRHRKSVTLGMNFDYQTAYQVELRWGRFFGGQEHNLIHDRDFVSATFKYSF